MTLNVEPQLYSIAQVIRERRTVRVFQDDPVTVDYYMSIPLSLIVVMKEDPRQKQWDEDYAAVCCVIQNLQLAAWEQGIGMVWKSNPYMYNPQFREAADVQPGEKIVAVLHIGYPRIVPKAAPRTPAAGMLTVIDH